MITAAQRLARRAYIGSSDAAAIVGADPYRSAADVWLSKTADLAEQEGDALDTGNRLESVVLDWAEQNAPFGLRRDVFQATDDKLLCANFDALVANAPEVVEAKTTGITGPADPAFGEVTEGPDVELPERVIVQVHHQMYVAGPAYRVAWVPVLIGGKGFRLYRVDRTDAIADGLAARCREFMSKFVVPRVRPDDYRPSIDVLKRVRREPNATVDLPAELVDQWRLAGDVERAAREKKKEAEAALLAALGTAERGTFPGGELTYLETKRKGYVVEPTAFRTLRLKVAKG